jgi:hypothetical protein
VNLIKRTDTTKTSRRRSEQGTALMSALAIVAMTALLMSGVCVLASTQEVRQHRDSDYALAMQLAEAGINYELNCSSNNTCSGNGGAADTSSAPYSGTVPGVSGSFTAYANSTTPTLITATGTIGAGPYAVSRTVQMKVSGSSIFNGAYTLFGTQSTTINNNALTGTIGSNASVSGSPKSGSTATVVSHCTNNYQTCDTICANTFSSGWSTLSSSTCVNNQCANVYCYWSSWFQINSPFWCNQANYPPRINNVTTSATTFTDAQCQCYPGNTVILEPGDYYCTSFNCQNSSSCCVFDNNCSCVINNNTNTTPGPCRLWCGGSSGGNDCIGCTCSCTSSDKSLAPKCLYAKAGCTCTLTCANSCCCGFYGVKTGATGSKTSCCSCKIDKCTGSLSGTVIADNVTVTAATTGAVSSADLTNASDPQMQGGYGFSGGWTELLAPSAGAVFADGTNY